MEFEIKPYTNIPFVEVNRNQFLENPVYKSELIIGNITVRFTKRFSLFHGIMLRLVFGLKLKDLGE